LAPEGFSFRTDIFACLGNLFFSYIFSVQRFNIFRTCGKDFIKKTRNKKLKLLENLPAFAGLASPKQLGCEGWKAIRL
jgi:hypothetical protein